MEIPEKRDTMKFLITKLVVIGAMVGMAMFTRAGAPLPAADDEQAAVQAHQALNQALAKGDKTAAGQLLDAQFEWTDVQGKTRSKTETLENLAALASDLSGEANVETHNFGQVERFVGTRQNTRLVHLWVKRPEGWRAFAFLDVPIPAAGYKNPPTPPLAKGLDCINPCKELPFKPANAAQEGAMKAWLGTKIDEWHAIPDDWVKRVHEASLAISPTMYMNKTERLAMLVKQKETYGDGAPSPAVDTMQMYDFGNAVIMRSVHAPGPNGKRARAIRLFVNEGGVWKIAVSAQTNIG